MPFAAFNAKLEVEPDEGEFEVKATFTLGAGSDDINPLTEDVTLPIGAFSGCGKRQPALAAVGRRPFIHARGRGFASSTFPFPAGRQTALHAS